MIVFIGLSGSSVAQGSLFVDIISVLVSRITSTVLGLRNVHFNFVCSFVGVQRLFILSSYCVLVGVSKHVCTYLGLCIYECL